MLGWIADSRAFQATDGGSPKDWENIKFKLNWAEDALFEVEFWDTLKGEKIKNIEAHSKNGRLVLELPKFRNDIAFKLRKKSGTSKLAELP